MQRIRRHRSIFFLFFLACSFLHADQSGEDDFLPTTFLSAPSELIEGKVSVITGRVCNSEEDLVIAGAEPIRIPHVNGQVLPQRRAYCDLGILGGINSAEIISPSGVRYRYIPTGRVVQKDGKGWIKLRPNSSGLPSEHVISARSGHRDSYLLIDQKKKYLCYFGPDQTRRIYKRIKEKKHSCCFRIETEILSNGNQIVYQYDLHQRIASISSTNPSRTVVYASAQFQYTSTRGKSGNYGVVGSDGQTVTYRHQGRFVSQVDRGRARLNYHYCDLMWQGSRIAEAVLHQISSHQNRFMDFAYHNSANSGPIRGLVKSIQAPVGEDATPYTTSSFIYSPEERKTTVFDIDQNRTEYFWSGSFLDKIIRYRSDGRLIGSERYAWKSFGFSKSFFNSVVLVDSELLDENHCPIKSRKFTHDEKGNLKTEKLTGNLSGGESAIPAGDFSRANKIFLS